jgi:hypothetical protein
LGASHAAMKTFPAVSLRTGLDPLAAPSPHLLSVGVVPHPSAPSPGSDGRGGTYAAALSLPGPPLVPGSRELVGAALRRRVSKVATAVLQRAATFDGVGATEIINGRACPRTCGQLRARARWGVCMLVKVSKVATRVSSEVAIFDGWRSAAGRSRGATGSRRQDQGPPAVRSFAFSTPMAATAGVVRGPEYEALAEQRQQGGGVRGAAGGVDDGDGQTARAPAIRSRADRSGLAP